jgi:anthranilate/para-aminobenzoate synthase component II
MLKLLIVDRIDSFTVTYMQQVVFLAQQFTLGLHLPRKVKFTEGY